MAFTCTAIHRSCLVTVLWRRVRRNAVPLGVAISIAVTIVFLYTRWPSEAPHSKESGLEVGVEHMVSHSPTSVESKHNIQTDVRQIYDKQRWPESNYNVHVFYYAWYGSKDFDQKWYHWNHRYLPHWDNSINLRYPTGRRHQPPQDIGANFYPKLGPYSSRDPAVIDQHMYDIRLARIGVVAVSWYPVGHADDEGKPADEIMPIILDTAHKYHLKVCFHVEPFDNRNAQTMREAIKYIIDKYGNHPAFYKKQKGTKSLPLFYIYDSYTVLAKEWNRVFGKLSELSVRDTDYDGLFIGLVARPDHQEQLYNGGFDGMYTYFASNTFEYGSRPSNWMKISDYCKRRSLMFIPSVGPGYIDTEVRPWNGENTKSRADGKYYTAYFKQARLSLPDIVSITSYNEWHEGTQIEPAIPFDRGYGKMYSDYGGIGKDYKYINLTRTLIETLPDTPGAAKLTS